MSYVTIVTGGVAVYNYNPVNGDIVEYVWKIVCPVVADDDDGKTTHPNPQQACSELMQYKGDLSSLKETNKNNEAASYCSGFGDDQGLAALSIKGKLHEQKVEVMEIKYSNQCTLQAALADADLSHLVPFDNNGDYIPPTDTVTTASS